MRVETTRSYEGSLGKLGPDDARHVAAFVRKLEATPSLPGVHLEPVREAHDKRVRSARVSRDLRAIAFVEEDRVVLIWVGQHDMAYTWAASKCISCSVETGEVTVEDVR